MKKHWVWIKLAIVSLGFPLFIFISYPFYSAWHDSFDFLPQAATATPLPANPPLYSTYVIIWIDDFRKASPLVETVWVVWVPTKYSTIELENLSPGSYPTSYSHALKGMPIESLPSKVQKLHAGVITLDHTDLGELANLLGGIQIGNQTLTADTLAAYLANPTADSVDDHRIRQNALMQAMIAQLTISSHKIGAPDFLKIPSQTTINEQILNNLIAKYYPLSVNALKIRP